MRKLIHGAVIEARELLDAAVGDIRRENKTRTDDEVLARYMVQHRGNAKAIANFAARFGKGKTPLHAAYNYERAMEKALKERRGKK